MIAPDLQGRLLERLCDRPAIVADLAADFRLPVVALKALLRDLQHRKLVRAVPTGGPSNRQAYALDLAHLHVRTPKAAMHFAEAPAGGSGDHQPSGLEIGPCAQP